MRAVTAAAGASPPACVYAFGGVRDTEVCVSVCRAGGHWAPAGTQCTAKHSRIAHLVSGPRARQVEAQLARPRPVVGGHGRVRREALGDVGGVQQVDDHRLGRGEWECVKQTEAHKQAQGCTNPTVALPALPGGRQRFTGLQKDVASMGRPIECSVLRAPASWPAAGPGQSSPPLPAPPAARAGPRRGAAGSRL